MRRLFWRAGFGATAAETAQWAARGRAATVAALLAGGTADLRGPEPSADGQPLDPENEFGHDVLWWLDRMVRSTRPLEEKMTLLWHDHFATRDQDTPLMLDQNRTLRAHALGDFGALLRAVALDPAMQLFLSLAGSDKAAPNENFARELMELFTLGSGYTEQDIREAARALTGFRAQYSNGRVTGVAYDPAHHDDGVKTIFGQTGHFDWQDVLRLCTSHPAHAPFLVTKLWAFFVGTPLHSATRRRLVSLYRRSGLAIAPVVRAILLHDDLYASLSRPDMVKWPVVYMAGQLRAMGAGVERQVWDSLLASMGQRLFAPPSVAGWDWGSAWMSSNAMRARFQAAGELVRPGGPADGPAPSDLTLDAQLAAAQAATGIADVSRSSRLVLGRLVAATPAGGAPGLQRSLRHLLISGPDNQLC